MKLTITKNSVFLCFILVIVLIVAEGCSSQKMGVSNAGNPANTLTSTSHPSVILFTAEVHTPTITPGIPYPSSAIMTITPAYPVLEQTNPSPYPTDTLVPTQTSTPTKNGPCSTDYKNPTLILTPDQKSGWCKLDHPLDDSAENYGYRLNYPNHWSVRLAGYVNANLMFNDYSTSAEKPKVFILLVYSILPLEMADLAKSSQEDTLLIDPSETKLQKEITTIGNKKMLVVDTELGLNRMKYYFFFLEAGNQTDRQRFLFMVRVKVDQSEASTEAFSQSLKEIELLVGSLEFYRKD